jgi:hypothetical protein
MQLSSKPLCYTGEYERACGNGGAAPPRRASGRSSCCCQPAAGANPQCLCPKQHRSAHDARGGSLGEVALLETEHAVKVEALEALLLEVRQERGVAERERATFLDLLAARKILEEERAHLS